MKRSMLDRGLPEPAVVVAEIIWSAGTVVVAAGPLMEVAVDGVAVTVAAEVGVESVAALVVPAASVDPKG